MDFIKNAMGGEGQGSNNNQQHGQGMQQGQNNMSGQQNQNSGGGGGGFLGGIGDKLNSAAGGGRESEKNEDYLDKGQSAHSLHSYQESRIVADNLVLYRHRCSTTIWLWTRRPEQ